LVTMTQEIVLQNNKRIPWNKSKTGFKSNHI
jgi:hypothetical protein